jgi:hypothetical protein
MSKTTVVKKGMKTTSVLGVLFVVLKLTGFITWSWWWVTVPFWGGWALIFIGLGLFVLLALLLAVIFK